MARAGATRLQWGPIVAICALVLAGCAAAPPATTPAPATPDAAPTPAVGTPTPDPGPPEETRTLGYSTGFLDNPALAYQLEATLDLAMENGIDTLAPTNADGDPGQQITDVRNLISAGADGLIVIVADSSAIVPALDDAAQAGVPVVSIDIGPAGGEFYMLVKADNVGMGRDACMEMAEQLGGQGKVLNLLGDLATINGRDRTDGFNDCMRENYPNIEVIEAPTNWRPEDATSATATMLAAHPDLDGIYMQSDAVMLEGVLASIRGAERDPSEFVLISIDGTSRAHEAIRAGELHAAVSQPIDLYVEFGIKYIQDAWDGVVHQPGPTPHDSNIIEHESGNLADELPAPLVTTENVDDPRFWGNL